MVEEPPPPEEQLPPEELPQQEKLDPWGAVSEFCKNITTVSGVVLAATATLAVGFIGPELGEIAKYALGFSWIFLLAALGCAMYGSGQVIGHSKKALGLLEEGTTARKDYGRSATKWANLSFFALFIAGVAFVVFGIAQFSNTQVTPASAISFSATFLKETQRGADRFDLESFSTKVDEKKYVAIFTSGNGIKLQVIIDMETGVILDFSRQ